MRDHGTTDRWNIILAGGEGRRLASLTRALYGTDVPKQFAVLRGAQSMLQQTVARAALVGDLTRTVVVVAAEHAALANAQLAPFTGVRILAQPAQLDTGPGLMLALAYVRAEAPAARVVVLPADHDIPRPEALVEVLARIERHRPSRQRVTLIGAVADYPETEYGWIVHGERLAGHDDRHAIWTVRRFVEKPGEEIARRLRARGAVWNTFIAAGPVAAFWQLARTHLPRHARGLADWAAHRASPDAAARLRALYAELTPASWSRDVVAHAAGPHLGLAIMRDSGWSDWGSPPRVFASLHGSDRDRLLARVATAPARATSFNPTHEVALP